MKKRIALAAAIALAISVGGMLPASAKLGAPSLSSSSCAQAGGTVEVKAFDGDVTVSISGTSISVVVANEDNGSADCTAVASTVTNVLIKATDDTGAGVSDTAGTGNITIKLASASDNLTVFNYGSIPMALQAEGTLTFDGSDLTDTAYKPFIGTVTEDSFTIGSVVGTYYAGLLRFLGGDGADVFDASGVTTTDATLTGNDGDDTLKGGAGDDTLTGSMGDDVLYGNGGDDTLASNDGGVVCDEPWPGANPKDNPCKIENVDSGADQAWGGAGDDTFTPDGADVVAPGDGTDTVGAAVYQLRYSDSTAAVSINLTTAAGVVKSTAGDDYIAGFDEFVGSPLGDTLVGNGSANGFFGFDGADVIVGLGGADNLSGNGGTDSIKGGLGADTIWGDTGADKINGGADNDTIYGGGGDDILYGSVGDDVLRGMKGSDQAWGGRGTFDVCAAEVTDSCEFKK